MIVALTVIPRVAGAGAGEPIRADMALEGVQQMAKAVQLQLSVARQARDVVKTLCLADKLSRLELVERQTRRARDRLPLGERRVDANRPRDESSVIAKLSAQASSSAPKRISASVKRWPSLVRLWCRRPIPRQVRPPPTKDVRLFDGNPGTELVFGHDESGKTFVYRVRLVLAGGQLYLLEAGSAKEQMDRYTASVAWMLGSLRVN